MGNSRETQPHPKDMDVDSLKALGHEKQPILRVIRRTCLSCTNGYLAEIRHCPVTDCPLWPYRMGSNPFRTVTEGQRQAGKRLKG